MSPHTPYRPSPRRLSLLDDVRVAAPCEASWNGMMGDEQVRWCPSCEKSVYNLSAMTRAEAELLIATSGDLCIRLYRRLDGTVMTEDCPVGVRKRRHKRSALAIAGASAMTLAAAAVAAGASSPRASPVRRSAEPVTRVIAPVVPSSDPSFPSLTSVGMGMMAWEPDPRESGPDGIDVIRPRPRKKHH